VGSGIEIYRARTGTFMAKCSAECTLGLCEMEGAGRLLIFWAVDIGTTGDR
jgi:hypothetical protein